MQGISEMHRVAKAALVAAQNVGGSVDYARRGSLDEAYAILTEDPQGHLRLFGVKNTDQISGDLVQKLKGLPGFIFHTVDTMAPGGRAVDPNLVNPLTGRMMTGSSSASCINILLGINDLALATDGGGSVLAPAIATGLYSIMAKGLGLKGSRFRISSDSIQFVPGIGLISHSYDLCTQAITHLTGVEVSAAPCPPLALIKPRDPQLYPVMEQVRSALKAEVSILENPSCQDRNSMIAFLETEFKRSPLILSFEGPVDLEGYGDSVLGVWGNLGQAVQAKGGKDLLKVANMVDATAVGVPAQELACGVLILAAPGRETGSAALALGAVLAKSLPRPQLFEEYFIRGWTRWGAGYI